MAGIIGTGILGIDGRWMHIFPAEPEQAKTDFGLLDNKTKFTNGIINDLKKENKQ